MLLTAHPCPPPAGRTPSQAGFMCVGTAPRPTSSPSWLSSIQQPALEHCWNQRTAHSPSCTHTHTQHTCICTYSHAHTPHIHPHVRTAHSHSCTHTTQYRCTHITYTLMNTPHACKRVCAHTHTHTIYTLVHVHTHGHAWVFRLSGQALLAPSLLSWETPSPFSAGVWAPRCEALWEPGRGFKFSRTPCLPAAPVLTSGRLKTEPGKCISTFLPSVLQP